MFKPLILSLIFLGICASLEAQSPKGKPAKEDVLSEEVLGLQGVWAPVDEDPDAIISARLVVHGSYFLLIYPAAEGLTRIVEVRKFKADGEKIINEAGDKVLSYILSSDGPSVSFEVRDESPNPTSKYAEFELRRIGKLPDLNLAQSKSGKK